MCRRDRNAFKAEHETQRLESIELHTKTPCCGRPIRIAALLDVPKQVQDRTCRACGQRWEVTRRLAKEMPAGGRVDILEWEPIDV